MFLANLRFLYHLSHWPLKNEVFGYTTLAKHMTLHIHPFAARSRDLGHGATVCAGGYSTTQLPPQLKRHNRNDPSITHPPPETRLLTTALHLATSQQLNLLIKVASAILRNSELSTTEGWFKQSDFFSIWPSVKVRCWVLLPGSTASSALRKVSLCGATLVRVSPIVSCHLQGQPFCA